MNTASASTLENEFGTKDEEEVIKQILEKGTLQESSVRTLPISPAFDSMPSHGLLLLVFKVRMLIRFNCSSPSEQAQRTTAWEPAPATEYCCRNGVLVEGLSGMHTRLDMVADRIA